MAHFVGKLHTLVAFGHGLLSSLATVKAKLSNPESRPECLSDAKLSSVRKHFQSHFPDALNDKVRARFLVYSRCSASILHVHSTGQGE